MQLRPVTIDRLRDALAQIGAPVLDHLQPGLTKAEVDAVVEEIRPEFAPFLTDEVYVWFSWHNGVNFNAALAAKLPSVTQIAPWGYELASLEGLLQYFDLLYEGTVEIHGHMPDNPEFLDLPMFPILFLSGGPISIRQQQDKPWCMYWHDTSAWWWEPIGQQQIQQDPPTLFQWVEALTEAILGGRVTANTFGGLIWHEEMTATDQQQSYPWV